MLPNVNFNPSFANLAALRGLGGMSHPIRPIGMPMPWQPPPTAPMTGGGAPPMPGPAQGYTGIPPQQMTPMLPGAQPSSPMPGPMPGGNLSNLRALMQLLGQGGQNF